MKETDWLDKPYYSLNAYFRATYGQKIYKISVNAGLTCPNRDGELDNRGCIFCSAGGSGDFAVDIRSSLPFEHRSGSEERLRADSVYHREYSNRGSRQRQVLDVERQIERGMARFNKSVGEQFVIYFQAYTNTYGDLEYLRDIWTAALSHKRVVGISIATRPDCLSDDVMELLAELKEKYCSEGIEGQYMASDHRPKKFIWIELGLQTMHEQTAEYIRRHYPLSVYEEAVRKLYLCGIPYITHIILGLPGETKGMMLQTVDYVSSGRVLFQDCAGKSELSDESNQEIYYPPQGIKLQLLHVLKGTDLASLYNAGEFMVLDMNQYIDIVIESLRRMNPDIVIHRVTGDGPKSILVAPMWSGNKKLVLNTLHKRMKELRVRQGDLYGL